MSTHRFAGGCHCGNLFYQLETNAGLDRLGLRACQCRFCRAHGARNTSDPQGRMRISARDTAKLVRYRFGLGTADFLICAECGVYIGACLSDGDRAWMSVNANSFAEPPPPDHPIVAMNFDAEDAPARIARRKARWTPVVFMRDGENPLDLRGLKCPLPALFARRALGRAAAGTEIEILADDPMAVIDVPHMCAQERFDVLAIVQEESVTRLRLRRPA